MKVITANVNGIRAAARKGFFDWLAREQADVVCLQETKATMAELLDPMLRPDGYHCYFTDATKKGYSGVGIYSKLKPDRVINTLGWHHADFEGRYIQADFADLSIVSLYLPSGSSGDERQQVKFDFMKHYLPILKKQRADGRRYIICGDWNIVHKEIDIKNFKSNQKNSGCLPEERAWVDALFTDVGFVDAFRVLNKNAEEYTWWSNRGRARENNVGWRIDYQLVTPDLAPLIKKVSVYKDTWFSDHAPLIVEYEFGTKRS